MFTKFFDRLNANPKKATKQTASSRVKSPTPVTGHPNLQHRISSLSPPSTQNPIQYNFPQYSPNSISSKNISEPRRLNTTHNILSTASQPKFNENQIRIVSTPLTADPVIKEKPKKAPNFEFRPLDRDSMLGSIAETTREGSSLAQNIYATKIVNTSKLSQPIDIQPSQQLLDHLRMQTKPHSIPTRQASGSDKRQEAWQNWWTEKKKVNSKLLQSAQTGNLTACHQLLDRKKGDLMADINFKGENDWTPLHFSCVSGSYEVVNFLIGREANIDAETTLKFTPLHIAAQKGNEEIALLLINSGADVNCKDIYNNMPLHYAAQNRCRLIVKLLLSRPSINFNSKNNENKTPYELSDDKDIKKLFEVFMAEKNLLNTKFTQRVTIFNTQTENIKKMFENIGNMQTSPTSNSPMNKQPLSSNINLGNMPNSQIKNIVSLTKKNMEMQVKNKMATGTTGTTSLSNETKANSSINSNDSELSNGLSGGEEEKIGPQSFVVHSLIGKGSFGEVYLVEKKNTGMYYAMKVLYKTKITRHNLTRYALTERNVLSLTNHPFIVKLNFAFQTAEKLFLILDYCPGGDLGEHLQRERRFTEERAKIYLAEIVLALEDLHKRDIIFRDLKPDNIVLDAEGHAMLTDFGLSKEGVLEHAQGAGSFCGSVAYLAPEMLKRVGHGKAVDWYLLGVVFYEMLVGVPPYYANNREQLFYNIQKAALKLPSFLSTEAKSLLKGLLQRNPVKRLGSGKGDAEEVKTHKFFDGINWKDVEQKKLKPQVPERKVKISARAPAGVFELNSNISSDQDRINGWSFVAPKYQGQSETLTSRLS